MLQSKEDVLNKLNGKPIVEDNSGSSLRVDIGTSPTSLSCVAGNQGKNRISMACKMGKAVVASSISAGDQFWRVTHQVSVGTLGLQMGCQEMYGGYLQANVRSAMVETSFTRSRHGSSLSLFLEDLCPQLRMLVVQTYPPFLGASVVPMQPLRGARLRINAVTGGEWPPQVETSWLVEWASTSLRVVHARNVFHHFGVTHAFGPWRCDAALLGSRRTATLSFSFSGGSVGLSLSQASQRTSFGIHAEL
jgi:hypothetical protein